MNIKKELINMNDAYSIREQCNMLGMNRSSLYYDEKPPYSSEDIAILHAMDEIFTAIPFYGYRRLHEELIKKGFSIGNNRVNDYMHVLGLKTFYPKKNTSIRNPEHKVYPYLLKEINIEYPNQVWAADITYIRMTGGFCYLFAIIDWYSRFIINYRLSNSLDANFCIGCLEEAYRLYSKPKIFNTDQGCQFTSDEFTKLLHDQDILISMDSKGRALDNIMIERFFRSIKYEDIYLYDYKNMSELKEGIKRYMHFYNYIRGHSTFGYKVPAAIYNGGTIN